MGQNLDHALGRSRKCFAKAETTFGTQVLPVATDAFKVTKPIKFDAKTDRVNRDDNRNTRDYLERITRMTAVAWDFECYLLPSGTPGTAPNVGKFLKVALGSETFPGGTAALYGLSNAQAMGSLSVTQNMNDVLQECAIGAWVDEVMFKVSGKDEPRLTFAGGAAQYAVTGTTTSNGVVAGAAVSFTVGTAFSLQVGSVFKVAGDAGVGYTVSAVNAAGTGITFSPGAVTGWANGAAVTPAVPASETTLGSPLNFTLGSMTIDAVAVPVVEFEVKVKNTIKPIIDEAFIANAVDYIPNNREVTGAFTLRGRKDQIIALSKRWNLTSRALVVTIGTVAGKKLVVSLPTAEFEFAPNDIPNVDEVLMHFPFVGLGSAGEDSLSFNFN